MTLPAEVFAPIIVAAVAGGGAIVYKYARSSSGNGAAKVRQALAETRAEVMFGELREGNRLTLAAVEGMAESLDRHSEQEIMLMREVRDLLRDYLARAERKR